MPANGRRDLIRRLKVKAIHRLSHVSANPASCPQGTADFFRGDKSGRGVKLTTHLHLMPVVKKKKRFDLHSHSLNVTPDTVRYPYTKPSAHLSFYYDCKRKLVITVVQISPFPPIHATASWHPCSIPTKYKNVSFPTVSIVLHRT